MGLNQLQDSGHTLNTWLDPLEREMPPRIDPEQEVVEMEHDLSLMDGT